MPCPHWLTADFVTSYKLFVVHTQSLPIALYVGTSKQRKASLLASCPPSLALEMVPLGFPWVECSDPSHTSITAHLCWFHCLTMTNRNRGPEAVGSPCKAKPRKKAGVGRCERCGTSGVQCHVLFVTCFRWLRSLVGVGWGGVGWGGVGWGGGMHFCVRVECQPHCSPLQQTAPWRPLPLPALAEASHAVRHHNNNMQTDLEKKRDGTQPRQLDGARASCP